MEIYVLMRITILSILFFFFSFQGVLGQNTLKILGKITDSFGPIEGSTIKVETDTSRVATYKSNKEGSFYFELDFGGKYWISFTKAGFSKKRIIVSTKLPEDKSSDVQQLLTLELELIEKLNDSDEKNEPLGVVSFNRITKEFSYESKFDDNKFTNIEVAGTDYYLAERKNHGIPRKKAKEIKEKIRYDEINISERKENFFEKILKKRSTLLADNNSYNKKRPEKDNLIKEIPMDTAISYYSSFNMDITEIVLNDKKILRVYHRVEHDWGGVFYFKNYRAISKTLFYLETELNKKRIKSSTSLHSAFKSH